ncbi:translation initiation factor IF-2-like [Artibeus jamaicensis]|uniref:translation initiation factor IF-2-like n=1 Tax=Artibeus jamaicensis TaxID=9417 RepID=UPI00235AABC3|nr:translation initiation factor IF-2-like [Artibeus jamaicensis]
MAARIRAPENMLSDLAPKGLLEAIENGLPQKPKLPDSPPEHPTSGTAPLTSPAPAGSAATAEHAAAGAAAVVAPAKEADRGRGLTERAVPDGDSGPQPKPAWRRAAARAPLRGQPLSSFCAAASAPASVPNFPAESRLCFSCGGAALSPGPRNCSPPPLRRQDPLKIWRPRTSFLGPLRESRNASLQDPWLPVDAKFQLVRPEKESAPLVQCDTASEFSGTKSKSCSLSVRRYPRPSAASSLLVAKLPKRLPGSAAGVPPARPATAPLPQPQPLQTLPPPLTLGAEQEPRASASARPASAGRAGSASSLGDGAAPVAPVRPPLGTAVRLGRCRRPRTPPGSPSGGRVLGGSAGEGGTPACKLQEEGGAG